MQNYTFDERLWLEGKLSNPNVTEKDLKYFYAPFYFCCSIEAFNKTLEKPRDYDYMKAQTAKSEICSFCQETTDNFSDLIPELASFSPHG